MLEDPITRGVLITLTGAALIGLWKLVVWVLKAQDKLPELDSSVKRAHERINEVTDSRKRGR